MEYQLELLNELIYRINKNGNEEKLNLKARQKKKDNKKLTEEEVRALYNYGKLYSKASIRRLRIELNKSLIKLGY